MEFSTFIKRLKTVIGGSDNTVIFTRTIFELMVNEKGLDILDDKSDNTLKSYYNGYTSISKFASVVMSHLDDTDAFVSHLESYGETASQLLADNFVDEINDINASNAPLKIYDLFLDIIRKASNKKSTQKSAKENMVVLPEERPSNEVPYSEEDKCLLGEFTRDYDIIISALVSEDYSSSLIDMSFINKINKLYESKWMELSNNFNDATLKSYVYGLLGELNTLTNSFNSSDSNIICFNNIRKKFRNLYVKLHPERFAGCFPYEAFIDDWNDGELY